MEDILLRVFINQVLHATELLQPTLDTTFQEISFGDDIPLSIEEILIPVIEQQGKRRGQ